MRDLFDDFMEELRNREAQARGETPRRPPGGPRDGAAEGGNGRRIGIGIVAVAIIAIFLLLSVGIDLWTDAIWYRSIGFDSVFWTRIVAQSGWWSSASSWPWSSSLATYGSPAV